MIPIAWRSLMHWPRPEALSVSPFRLLSHEQSLSPFVRPAAGQSISRILQSLTVTHTWCYHKRYHSSGHVWQGRFRSPVIQGDAHLLVVLRYIEANPLRARLVENLADYRWSSYPFHGLGQVDPLLSPLPGWRNSEPPRRNVADDGEPKCASQSEAELTAVRSSLQNGRPLGTSKWVEQIAERLNIDLVPERRGRPPKEK